MKKMPFTELGLKSYHIATRKFSGTSPSRTGQAIGETCYGASPSNHDVQRYRPMSFLKLMIV